VFFFTFSSGAHAGLVPAGHRFDNDTTVEEVVRLVTAAPGCGYSPYAPRSLVKRRPLW